MMKKEKVNEEIDPFICKFQRPLVDTAGEEGLTRVLIYNEDNSVTLEQLLENDDVAELFPDGEYKTYWICVVDEDGYIVPYKQTEEQDW